MTLQTLVNGGATGCVIAISALGFALVSATTKGLHLAHGAVVAIGGLFAIVLTSGLSISPAVAIFSAAACSAFVGVTIERFVYWPLSKDRAGRTTLLLASLGVYLFLTGLLALTFGQTSLYVHEQMQTTRLGGAFVAGSQRVQFVVGITLCVAVTLLLLKTKFGLLLRAQADDTELLEIVGGQPRQLRVAAAALGSALAGTAGALVGLDIGMDPQYGLGASITAAVATILAGPGLGAWPAVAGALIGILQAAVGTVVTAKWTASVTYVLLVAFLLRRISVARREFLREGQ